MDMEYGPYSDFDSGHARANEANQQRMNHFMAGRIHGDSALRREMEGRYDEKRRTEYEQKAKYGDYQPGSDSKHYKGVDGE
jgi:hypothetical protein